MRVYEMPEAIGAASWKPSERPMPTPGAREVLVRLRAVSLNYRDLLISRGGYGAGGAAPNLIPLSDGAGEVVSIGDGVSRVSVGDRVTNTFFLDWPAGADALNGTTAFGGGSVDGVLSEYRVFDQDNLVPVPAHLSFEEAATLPCAAVTAWNALYGIKPLVAGQTVLVLGTGGVSMFALQLAKAAGAKVIATSSSDDKLAVARRLGADETINYRETPDWQHAVRRLNGGSGVDHVVEVGGAGTLPRSLGSVGQGGVVSIIGMVAGGTTIDPLQILMSNSVVRGVRVGSREMFEAMNRVIVLHGLRPVIDRVFGFEQAPDALAHLEAAGHVGKVVVTLGG